MRRTRRRTIAIAGILVLSAATIASCGGDEVSADEYVGALCSATAGFSSTVVEGQAAVQEAASGTVSPEEGKAELTSFFEEADAAGEEAASQIEDAGVPDVENGEEIADALSDGLRQRLRRSLRRRERGGVPCRPTPTSPSVTRPRSFRPASRTTSPRSATGSRRAGREPGARVRRGEQRRVPVAPVGDRNPDRHDGHELAGLDRYACASRAPRVHGRAGEHGNPLGVFLDGRAISRRSGSRSRPSSTSRRRSSSTTPSAA